MRPNELTVDRRIPRLLIVSDEIESKAARLPGYRMWMCLVKSSDDSGESSEFVRTSEECLRICLVCGTR